MIEIRAFAGFQFRTGERSLALKNRKTQALLIYLACNHNQEHQRPLLADLLWPAFSLPVALNNLSKALGHIRKVFAGGEAALNSSRTTISLSTSPQWQLDANQFSQLREQAQVAGNPTEKATLLEQATALYQGEFMAGFSLGDCPTFEGWLLLQRENFMLQVRDAHQWLAGFYLHQGAFAPARDHARRQIGLDAWHEEAHRQLMRALYGLGQRGASLAQYEACREVLHADLGLEPEPATRALYEQVKHGRVISEAPATTADGQQPEARLPKQLVALVGREKEIKLLREDITDPTYRLITIAGPGGVGKTSLALEVGWQTTGYFAGGAAFVSLEHLQILSGADLHGLLASSIGAALEISFAGTELTQQQLFRHLSDQEMLLILDNFEHLMTVSGTSQPASGAAFITSLLEKAPGIKVLLTSRERLAIPAERVLTLEGLPVPIRAISLAQISDYSSIRLFVDQARRIQRDFRLTAGNYSAVRDICAQVEGLPLGIQLAARWIPHFSPAEIASAIQENIDFLAATDPQGVKRHQSIGVTFAYSWQMLSQSEQHMLSRLSIIPGSFSRQAALVITQGKLGDLVQLQGKSLLRQDKPGHYSLHQLLRQYAAQKLEEGSTAEISYLKRRFAHYYLEELAQQGVGFNEDWTGAALKTIAGNLDNIRAAWQIALDRRYYELLNTAMQPLYHYFRLQGLFHEAQQIFSHTAALFRLLLEENENSSALQVLLGRALLRQARLVGFLHGAKQAIPLLQEGLDYLRQAGTQKDLSRGYAHLGEALLDSDRLPEAVHLLTQALDLYRKDGDQNGVALTLEIQAVIASRSGQSTEANRLYQESISISRRNGNRWLEGRAYHDWGILLLQQGEFAEAGRLLQDSLAIAQELELRMPVAFNESMLARIDRQDGRLSQARTRLEDSLEIIEGSGYTYYLLSTLNMLGEVLTLTGEIVEAKKPLSRALAYLEGLGTVVSAQDTELALDFLTAAAHYLAATGCPSMARRCCRLVLTQVSPESNLARRIRQLVGETCDEEIIESKMGKPSLADMIGKIRL